GDVSGSAAPVESGDFAGAAGSHLPCDRARSKEPLPQGSRDGLGPGASGPGGRGRAPRTAGMEETPPAVGAADFFLHHDGADPGGDLRAAAVRREAQLIHPALGRAYEETRPQAGVGKLKHAPPGAIRTA